MPSCESFEKLISKSIDQSLTSREEQSLNSHLTDCRSCLQFQETAYRHSRLMHSLPQLDCKSAPRPRAESKPGPGIVRRLWQVRVAIPLPAAALILATFVGLAYLSIGEDSFQDHGSAPQSGTEVRRGEKIGKTQFVKFRPQAAQRVDKNG
jgi:hypothetical protein